MLKREFASFGGPCPYNCRFCYTFNPNYKVLPDRTVDEIVYDLADKEVDLIYISGHRESFVDPDNGIELIEKIFNGNECNILFTTRNVFSSSQIERLSLIKDKMLRKDKFLFACISIPAVESYSKIEDIRFVKTPNERIEFIKQLYLAGLKVLLTIRPLFPNNYIDISEPLRIIDSCKNYIDCVISSGIIIDDFIETRLFNFPKDIEYLDKPLMECLNNNYNVKYVNVCHELSVIDGFCKHRGVKLFETSIPAIEYIIKKDKENYSS